MIPQIGSILLAAGESRRMGTPKQLLIYKGKTLICHTINELITANCNPIVVVLGAYSDRIEPEINNLRSSQAEGLCSEFISEPCTPRPPFDGGNDSLPVHICHNPRWQQGMSSSIVKGLQVLLKINLSLEAVMIALVDQPLITANIYHRLITNYFKSKGKATTEGSSVASCVSSSAAVSPRGWHCVIASSYADTIGVPALFPRTFFDELLKLNDPGGAKQLLKIYSDRKFNLNLPEAAIDIDTPNDYQHLLDL